MFFHFCDIKNKAQISYYIYFALYIYILFTMVIFHICMSLFESFIIIYYLNIVEFLQNRVEFGPPNALPG